MFRRKTPEERIERAVLRSLRARWQDHFKPESERGLLDDWIVSSWELTRSNPEFGMGTELTVRMVPRERYEKQHKIEYGNSEASIKVVDLDG